nr:urocortin-3-like [Nerophis lumbriciformis]
MLSSLKTLLLLSVLCTPSSSLCLRLVHGRADVLCERQMAGGFSPEDGWSSLLRSSAEFLAASGSEESASREKRTFNPARSRFQSPAKLRNVGKKEHRSWRYLSLDVPTYIMNVRLTKAKEQQLRKQLDANALLLASIGRRK